MIELCYLTVTSLTNWQNFGNCSDGLNELTKNIVSEHACLRDGGAWEQRLKFRGPHPGVNLLKSLNFYGLSDRD